MATMSSSPTTGPAILPGSPDEETASSDEENLYGGSGQPSADGESSSESESDDDNSEFGQHYFTRTS